MVSYPARWEADVVLRDGAIAHLRPIRPEDADALQRFHLAQSDESVYLRFFAPLPRLSDRDLQRFTVVDHQERVALVITIAGELAGIGRYDKISAASAEVAFNISDAHQGRGLGSVLLEHLTAAARENGIRRFTADVLPQNRKMLSVFTDAGYEVQQRYDDGVITLAFDIDPTDRSREVAEAREHRSESLSMRAVLHPASVALIGASRRSDALGQQLLAVLQSSGFTGALHLVHPEADQVHGVPALRQVTDIPGRVDLAVVAVPVGSVVDVIDDCARAGVRSVVVLSAGFGEGGVDGRSRQSDLLRRTRSGGMRLVGPGSWGVLNVDPRVRLNATSMSQSPPNGRLGMFCESGGLSAALLDLARRRDVGISTFLSAGERLDVSANDCLQYWEADDATDAIALYLESAGNPRKFSRIARRVSRSKPIVVLTSGTTGFSASAYSPPKAFDALLTQAGCIRVGSQRELMDVSRLLADQALPAGDRVAVVANSPALARLVGDSCLAKGLRVVRGPVSVSESATGEDVAEAVLQAQTDPRVDAVVVVQAPLNGDQKDTVSALLRTSCTSTTPVVGCMIAWPEADRFHGDDLDATQRDADGRNRQYRIPFYTSPEEAVTALAQVVGYSRWRTRDPGHRPDLEGCDRDGAAQMVDRLLDEHPAGVELDQQTSAELLGLYGITVWPSVVVKDGDEAVAAAERLGWPVVLRSDASALRHRIDLGGIRLAIGDAEELRRDLAEMRELYGSIEGGQFSVQKMATPGVACVIRSVEDSQLGPVLSFGLGGDASELLGDVVHRVTPLTDRDVSDMVHSVGAAPKLLGQRGGPSADIGALEDLLARVAALTDDLTDVAEIEINPVVVATRGLAVLSARVRLARLVLRADARRELSAAT